MNKKVKNVAILAILASVFVGLLVFDFFYKKIDYKKGLDISGGAQLVFSVDVSSIPQEDLQDTLSALRDTVERRVNLFGVGEPSVYIQKGSFVSQEKDKYRLVVEIPGVVDANEAIKMIGETPVLEFKMKKENGEFDKAMITGKHIKKAALVFTQAAPGQFGGEPAVEITFNKEGAEIFANVTKENVGKIFGIFLDGELISDPVIKEPIYGGKALISGNFTLEEAKKLARELNYGALPAPVSLSSSQEIGATLGKQILDQSAKAGLIGFALVSLFMIAYYRWFGLLATFMLAYYVVFVLALFKLFGVTLTAAGLAGFILSVGMAVDANVLIFERIKEELSSGKKLLEAIENGFSRAWNSIRDANLSSLITALILFWFGTSIIEGFALVFAIGILASMITSVWLSKIVMRSFAELISNK